MKVDASVGVPGRTALSTREVPKPGRGCQLKVLGSFLLKLGEARVSARGTSLSFVGVGAPGWSSRVSQETPAPLSDWYVCSSCKWTLKGSVVH